MQQEQQQWVMTCTPGAESVLVKELAQLGAIGLAVSHGIVLANVGGNGGLELDVALKIRSASSLGVFVGFWGAEKKIRQREKGMDGGEPDAKVRAVSNMKFRDPFSQGRKQINAERKWGTLDGSTADVEKFRAAGTQHCFNHENTKETSSEQGQGNWKTAFSLWVTSRRSAFEQGFWLGEGREGPKPDKKLLWNCTSLDVDMQSAQHNAPVVPCKSDALTFCVRCCRREGYEQIRHKYNSPDLERELGASILQVQPAWRVNLTRPTLLVSIEVRGLFACISLNVAQISDARRMPETLRTATTRPDLAAAMWRLVTEKLVGPDLIACDIGCGVGTCLAEASLPSWNSDDAGRFCLGGDIEPTSAQASSSNLEKVLGGRKQGNRNFASAEKIVSPRKRTISFDVNVWNMCQLPLRDDTLDICFVDLPFGKMHLKFTLVRKLVPRAVAEVCRVLRPGGRALFMGSNKSLNRLPPRLPFDVVSRNKIVKGGIHVTVLVIEKQSSPSVC